MDRGVWRSTVHRVRLSDGAHTQWQYRKSKQTPQTLNKQTNKTSKPSPAPNTALPRFLANDSQNQVEMLFLEFHSLEGKHFPLWETFFFFSPNSTPNQRCVIQVSPEGSWFLIMGTPVESILIFSHDLLSHDALDAMTFLRKARIFELLVIAGLLPQEEKEPETVYLQC